LIYLLVRRYIRERQEIIPDRAQRSKNLCEGCNDEVLAMAAIERKGTVHHRRLTVRLAYQEDRVLTVPCYESFAKKSASTSLCDKLHAGVTNVILILFSHSYTRIH